VAGRTSAGAAATRQGRAPTRPSGSAAAGERKEGPDSRERACFDGLLFGSYTVHETVPTGYQGEADKTVTVDNTATCADNPYGGESVSFHNTPLTNLTVTVDSQVPGGTSSTIDCGVAAAGPGDDISASATNLVPGTYTCTIVVDP
jgi:hypothetical protein